MRIVLSKLTDFVKSSIFHTLVLIITDISVFVFSFIVSLWFFYPYIRLSGLFEARHLIFGLIIVLSKACIAVFMNLYLKAWEHADIKEFVCILMSAIIGFAADFIILAFLKANIIIAVIIMSAIISFVLMFLIRFSPRLGKSISERLAVSPKKRVMVVGAGEVGTQMIHYINLQRKADRKVVVCIDDNVEKHKTKLLGVPIIGGREIIGEAVKRLKIDEIIIAIAAAARNEIKPIIEICNNTGCTVNIIPALYEIMDRHLPLNETRKVNIYDLLGREEVMLDTAKIASFLKGKSVLVTGGGGSIGSELCRNIANYMPDKLIIFDVYENNAYELQNELKTMIDPEKVKLYVRIGTVCDTNRVEEIIKDFGINVIFHAAAHKHVPLMEDSPAEAIKNNVFGTYNVAKAADKFGVEKFVLISTDKAVNPSSIMGATKRMAELVIQEINRSSETEYVAVRFGNVLGSSGSVIPVFLKQIETGLPLTVTHPDITRFFMTIPEASRLVLQAGSMARGGEIFILDMGEPVKILDLAENLIKLLGYKPYDDIDIKFIGLRPGEKIYEELAMLEEEIETTEHSKIFFVKPVNERVRMFDELERLRNLIDSGRPITVSEILNIRKLELKRKNHAN